MVKSGDCSLEDSVRGAWYTLSIKIDKFINIDIIIFNSYFIAKCDNIDNTMHKNFE